MNTSDLRPTLWERSTTRRVLRWVCRWTTLRLLLVTLAVVVTLLAFFFAIENWRGKSAWEAHRRALEAQGQKFELTALAPPPLPDEQNLALAPLLKPVFDFSQGPSGLVWNDTNGLERLRGIDLWKRGRRDAEQPSAGNLLEFCDLESWRKFYIGNTNYPQAPDGSNAAEVVLAALGKFDGVFGELKAAAGTRPGARFPVHYEDEEPFNILLPHLAIVKGMASAMDLRATAALELKQAEAALSDWELAFRLADSIRDEPILISHLVRIAMLAAQLQVIREGLVRHVWTEAQLAMVGQRLGTIDLLAEYQKTIHGERTFAVTTVDWARRHRQAPYHQYWDSESGNHSIAAALTRWMPDGWFYRNMVTISRFHNDHTLRAVDSVARRVFPEVAAGSDQAIETLPMGPQTLFVKMLFPSLSKAALKSAQMQSQIDMARVACALERSRLVTGGLPEELGALVPRFLDRIPLDLFDGRPLRYRRETDGGYILYSVGWNGKDDGGTVAWTSSKKRSPDAQQGDWVWRLPR